MRLFYATLFWLVLTGLCVSDYELYKISAREKQNIQYCYDMGYLAGYVTALPGSSVIYVEKTRLKTLERCLNG